jgi:hypothetical protein
MIVFMATPPFVSRGAMRATSVLPIIDGWMIIFCHEPGCSRWDSFQNEFQGLSTQEPSPDRGIPMSLHWELQEAFEQPKGISPNAFAGSEGQRLQAGTPQGCWFPKAMSFTRIQCCFAVS